MIFYIFTTNVNFFIIFYLFITNTVLFFLECSNTSEMAEGELEAGDINNVEIGDFIHIRELVLTALLSLNEKKGSTCQEIADYIAKEYKLVPSKTRRVVAIALKRGVHCKLFRKKRQRFRIITNLRGNKAQGEGRTRYSKRRRIFRRRRRR